MAHEKVMGGARAADEGSAGDSAGETVLDFLWADETADGAVQDALAEAEDGLQGALARYARWLQSWGGPE